MDYGRNSQFSGDNNQPFFTAGAGNVSPNANYFESENNLDLTNQNSWSQAQNYQGYQNQHDYRDYRGIGSRAIMPSEVIETRPAFSEQGTDPNTPAAPESPSPDPFMPPNAPALDAPLPSQPEAEPTHHHHLIHADGDHISKTAIAEINQAIAKLSQTDNVSDFYATIRGGKDTPGMLQDYLKNSYNREVA